MRVRRRPPGRLRLPGRPLSSTGGTGGTGGTGSAGSTGAQDPVGALLDRRERAGAAAAAGIERAVRALRALPGWGRALVVYAASRVFTALLTLAVARWQHASLWTPDSPGYGTFTADVWDGTWYHRIAVHGYPLPLPRGPDGVVSQSEWAFYPAYPLLVRAVMALTGASWHVAGPGTSLVLGAGAAVVLHALFRAVATERAALGGVLLVCVYPACAVLQYAYTESLALLALAWALLALVRRRYGWCALAVALLGASRVVALPFAAVVLVHAVARWRAGRAPGGQPLGGRERAALAGLAAASVAAGLAWPLVVGVASGDLSAYGQVQGAWRGGGGLTPVLPWVVTSQRLAGQVGGPVLLAVAVVALVAWCTGPRARSLGPEVPGWVLAQTAYLLVVADPWTSTFRYWVVQAPLALLVAVSVRSRAHLLTWALASLALQVVWVAWLWRFSPPSDYPP